jgi:MOSC domain
MDGESCGDSIQGDAQGDLAGHGGEQRAVFVYQMDSYHYWEDFLGRSDFIFGQLEENFTVDGLLDSVVCIGYKDKSWNGSISEKPELIESINKKLSTFPGIIFNYTQPAEDAVDEALTGLKSSLAVMFTAVI